MPKKKEKEPDRVCGQCGKKAESNDQECSHCEGTLREK